MAQVACHGYNADVERFREIEFPMLRDTTYLDHAGTTLYSKTLIDRFSTDMISNLYGNPHSASESSQRSSRRVDDTRTQLLDLFHADPEEYDVVFVANATAGVKLVVEAFAGCSEGFEYLYHKDCHTSLVGVRECAAEHKCLESDVETEAWLKQNSAAQGSRRNRLFAYPAQSNMNGRRLPLSWTSRARVYNGAHQKTFTLLDAAALVSTTPLNLADPQTAPDFVVVSLYKIFGFPDLGALLVRKESGAIFDRRRYFGGGTVDMVLCSREQWHARKSDTLHDRLEDGTLPIHNIMALSSAMEVHKELFGSLERVSSHALHLAKRLYQDLSNLRHGNGKRVCETYTAPQSSYDDPRTQGPIVAINIRNSYGAWISNHEVEKLAAIKGIQLRTGGLCNPGGIASSLQLAPWEMRRNFSAGQRCGNENDIMHSKPTGMIRLSLGAMSTEEDVTKFTDFVREFFVNKDLSETTVAPPTHGTFFVESITVYPIKSCAGWNITGQSWPVRREGLEWDREWCLVHSGTATTLSQKRYPRMALIRPEIDLTNGLLRIRFVGGPANSMPREVTVPLSADPRYFADDHWMRQQSARVCGDVVPLTRYESAEINDFFSQALGVPCQLARLPPTGSSSPPSRYAKAHLQQHQIGLKASLSGASLLPDGAKADSRNPILLSNESPLLVVSRSSINRVNELIKASGGKAAQADVFRANIVVAEDYRTPPGVEQPYAEDYWRYMRVGSQYFQILGSCRRCQMICIDQQTGEKNQEPFVSLAKTRRFDGKVFFGQHACHLPLIEGVSATAQSPSITVGDAVHPYLEGDDDILTHLQKTIAYGNPAAQ